MNQFIGACAYLVMLYLMSVAFAWLVYFLVKTDILENFFKVFFYPFP